MAIPRPEVGDYIEWGKLIKAWAKGEKPAPHSLQDLLDQCGRANIGMQMPAYVTGLCVVQAAKETFVLRIPPADLIMDSEAELGQPGVYPIPEFYNQRYGKKLDVPQHEKPNFHCERTGDYVIRLCV